MSATDNSSHTQYSSIYKCICHAAHKKPDEAAIIQLSKTGREERISWEQLRRSVNRMAHYLKGLSIGPMSKVVVALPNSISTVIAALGVWRLAACTYFLSAQLTDSERTYLLDQIHPDLVLASWKKTGYPCCNVTSQTAGSLPDGGEELPDIVSVPARATATGGSTGIPKIIIEETAMHYGEADFTLWARITGQTAGQTQLVCGSLHHALFNNSFYIALAMGNSIVLMEKFNEDIALKAIENYHVNSLVLVPTMMSRIIKSPRLPETDLSSIACMHHAGASCPIWLKKEWIQLIGAKKVHEFYSMSEKVGLTYIRGDEWLNHEGSVGRPLDGGIEILDDEYNPVPPGVIGNVYFITSLPSPTHYLLPGLGPGHARTDSNAVSMGDLGYLDQDGYLYLVDRRCDMIISGGKNIYAAEVENALREYSKIADIVVIGLPDPVWGRRVHALIQPACDPESFNLYEFTNFGFHKLCNYKLPKTIELLPVLPRDDNGKIRRSLLTEERMTAADAPKRYRYLTVPNGHQLHAWKARRNKKQTK